MVARMDDAGLLGALHETARAVRGALDGLEHWGPSGMRDGQYTHDLVADAAALKVLQREGLAVLSEESGTSGGDRQFLVVLDPVDGSTNAARGLRWWATSLCVLDAEGPRVALVVNQATGVYYEAVRGGGAHRDGAKIKPATCERLTDAVIGVVGLPEQDPGWAQYRALGCASLDLCAVAEGTLDGYLPVGGAHLFAWDYLGGMMVCQEAGVAVGHREGADIVMKDSSPGWLAAAATPALLASLLAAGI